MIRHENPSGDIYANTMGHWASWLFSSGVHERDPDANTRFIKTA
jgi:hypothetical protein